ncbi:stress response translation initiation inhibitor YciH [Glaciecola siphonariae]|uniref:Stress response translation initiation inhibitor YciH n=1 Tax=Glaciecola siphonariae TaxID=521012 RepID=A0ABV9LSS3_9ALTE
MNNSRLVYSTDSGRISTKEDAKEILPSGDGIVRIKRITKGKKGKGVSSIEGLGMNKDELKTLCSTLKKQCGCGGAVKDYTIEIQGDVREKLKEILESKGMKVKLAGG